VDPGGHKTMIAILSDFKVTCCRNRSQIFAIFLIVLVWLTQRANESKIEINKYVQTKDDDLTIRLEPTVDLKSVGIDPTPYKEITNDPALIKILASYKKTKIGGVNQLEPKLVELVLEDGRKFKAAHIGEERSMADDGTLALDAITSPLGFPIKNIDATEGGVTVEGNPSEIWIVNSDGKTERLSPLNVHAKRPIISPDGRYVAYTAQYLVGGSLYAKVLIINDRKSGEISSYAERKHEADYEISPVDWVEGGKVLRVIEDWGETGGHMKLKEVRFDKND
jgi:hypothetical protein